MDGFREFEELMSLGIVMLGLVLSIVATLSNDWEQRVGGLGVTALGVALLWLTRL